MTELDENEALLDAATDLLLLDEESILLGKKIAIEMSVAGTETTMIEEGLEVLLTVIETERGTETSDETIETDVMSVTSEMSAPTAMIEKV